MNRFWTRRVCGAIAATALFLSACSGTPGSPTPARSYGPDAVIVEAASLAFAPRVVQTAAGRSVQLVLRNRDSRVPHNLELRSAGQVAFKGEMVTGPADIVYSIGPLGAGSYEFLCTVHPTMTGTIEVN